MNKIVLCGMSGHTDEDFQNLIEIIEPIKDRINKIVWTINYSNINNIYNLDSNTLFSKLKNSYNIYFVFNQWMFRSDFARNSYLFSGHIKHGDICINIDTLERLKPEFFNNFDNLIQLMTQNQIDGFVLHNKRFLFIYNDYLEHRGNPHEGIQGLQRVGELTNIDLYKNSEDYFGNVRSEKRDPYHFVDGFIKYYYLHPNSNHCLLGCEDDQELFRKREHLRRLFRLYCSQELKLDFTIESLKNYMLNNDLDDFMKKAFNQEKILNDFYRYHKLNDRNFKDIENCPLIYI